MYYKYIILIIVFTFALLKDPKKMVQYSFKFGYLQKHFLPTDSR